MSEDQFDTLAFVLAQVAMFLAPVCVAKATDIRLDKLLVVMYLPQRAASIAVDSRLMLCCLQFEHHVSQMDKHIVRLFTGT